MWLKSNTDEGISFLCLYQKKVALKHCSMYDIRNRHCAIMNVMFTLWLNTGVCGTAQQKVKDVGHFPVAI